MFKARKDLSELPNEVCASEESWGGPCLTSHSLLRSFSSQTLFPVAHPEPTLLVPPNERSQTKKESSFLTFFLILLQFHIVVEVVMIHRSHISTYFHIFSYLDIFVFWCSVESVPLFNFLWICFCVKQNFKIKELEQWLPKYYKYENEKYQCQNFKNKRSSKYSFAQHKNKSKKMWNRGSSSPVYHACTANCM